MHPLNKKIKKLEKILNKLVKYSKSFNKVECSVKHDFIIIKQVLKKPKYIPCSIKIPVSDIDKVIIRERAKLLVHKRYNNRPDKLEKAIKELG